MASSQDGRDGANDHDYMGDTADQHTNKDSLEAAELSISDISTGDGYDVGQEQKEKPDRNAELCTFA